MVVRFDVGNLTTVKICRYSTLAIVVAFNTLPTHLVFELFTWYIYKTLQTFCFPRLVVVISTVELVQNNFLILGGNFYLISHGSHAFQVNEIKYHCGWSRSCDLVNLKLYQTEAM